MSTLNYHKGIATFRARRAAMYRLKKAGMSYAEIAKEFHVSRQRVFQILAKERVK